MRLSILGIALALVISGSIRIRAEENSAEPPGTIPAAPEADAGHSKVSAAGVLMEIIEGVPDSSSWDFPPAEPSERYRVPAFAFTGVPVKYSQKAIRDDWSNPFLLRASGEVTLPAGSSRLLLRSRGAARVFLDGQLILETKFPQRRTDGHEQVHELTSQAGPNIRPLPPGDQEEVAPITVDGKPHRLRLETVVGGQKRRPELGETLVAWARPGEDFRIASPSAEVLLTDEAWPRYADQQRHALAELDARRRRSAGAEEAKYWQWRHELARRELDRQTAPPVPEVSPEVPVHNQIDRFVGQQLEKLEINPTPLGDDWTFLRRATLDLIGTVPTPEQIEEFFADREPGRRARWIDRLLDHPGWADHWVGYWQDVLAENPNILNPTLNNTGPFREWLYESFADNKPLDRLATELILMEGSKYFGGPAGFELATENDAPMAQKAHIVGQAFLGVEMKCARCHDAPNHPYTQKQLFSLAGMLRRQPQEVPKTSTIQADPERLASLSVSYSLKPGEKVSPAWPFEQLAADDLPEGVLRNAGDSRERLAALVTSPRNGRFAQVIINRLWHRYLGRGLVEPVDDWSDVRPSHPELLRWLAHELVAHGYDLKHVARLILNSHAYQREAIDADGDRLLAATLFAGPTRRRMTAEQIVDSLFLVAGKPIGAEELNVDVDGSRPYTVSLNLGVPRRAWQFTSLSNERDRPSLSLPVAQSVIDVLTTFGWRASRQSPITCREAAPNVLQPAILANGVMNRRITGLSDDSSLTALALDDQPVEALIERVFLRVLARPPRDDERTAFLELLTPGYADRRVKGAAAAGEQRRAPTGVSWSNHLSAEANRLKIELERQVRQGDKPTARLTTDWRTRMEDMVWSLVNSPEFVFVP